MPLATAPAWSTSRWFNTPEPVTLDGLRGRVVMLHAFQMLCPGCVSVALPQAQRVAALFAKEPVAVVGLPEGRQAGGRQRQLDDDGAALHLGDAAGADHADAHTPIA